MIIPKGLQPENYTVYASHPEDSLYKAINNTTKFRIIPVVDVSVTKNSDKNLYVLGENVIYTIVVTNNGPNIAHNVTLCDVLPSTLTLISLNNVG